ncbi:MAG: hypothetical protein AAF798_12600 [Bacteroidota bacterium]
MEQLLQQKLMDQIAGRFTKRSEAVEALSTILSVGKDAVYRRFRGDTLLTPDEIRVLSQKFQISLDALVFGETDSVFFTFNAFSQKINSIEDYLDNIKGLLHRLRQLPDVTIYYASSEIPFFYYSFFPELIGFKLYVFGRTVWDLDYLRQRPFQLNLLSPHALELTAEVLHEYIQFPTVELWSYNIFDNTLNQIEYHMNSGQFANPEDALVLCDRASELVDHMCLMAEHGSKYKLGMDPADGKSFELYHNEMIYTNNTIYVKSPIHRILFSTFASPNFLQTSDDRICDFIEDWFRKIRGKSNSISMQAEKSRNAFFNGLKRRISNVRKRLEVQLEAY